MAFDVAEIKRAKFVYSAHFFSHAKTIRFKIMTALQSAVGLVCT
jgi:hypothetical protein